MYINSYYTKQFIIIISMESYKKVEWVVSVTIIYSFLI